MLTDIQFKQSFTTLPSDQKLPCICGNYDRQKLREKLQEILTSLYEEIENKNKDIERAQKQHLEAIQEKQEIIERLASANSKLTIENQVLSRQLKRIKIKQQINSTKFTDFQKKYKDKLKEMKSIKEYLEQKNEELRNKITFLQPSISSQAYSMRRSHSPPFGSKISTPLSYSKYGARSSIGGESIKQPQQDINVGKYACRSEDQIKTQNSKKSSINLGTQNTNTIRVTDLRPKTCQEHEYFLQVFQT